MPEKDSQKLRVYYDGSCSVCDRFCRMISKSEHCDRIERIDFTRNDFDARAHGLDPEALPQGLHVRRPDGRILRDFDAVLAVWKILGHRWSAALGRLPVIHFLCQLGYRFFARHRHWFGRV